VRPTPDARVSAPLRWEEVAEVDPQAFTIETMRGRIAAIGDPTAGMWRRRTSLRSRFAKLALDPPEA
jgi:DNA primase